ncbi:Post-GPI attachment to proteins factor 2 [Portunus trituberculatus]|uniref:Post-GPI attachment to proteins factor 2 n=1 Tax=Portunus trituberculatus TaxID=210409 RepID=A0A5B7K1J8_PORTR|nr:Post-GPI attachment to proteins factor 2 [Portunus trituberculatus]
MISLIHYSFISILQNAIPCATFLIFGLLLLFFCFFFSFQNAVKITTCLNVVENIALIFLSFVSSKENYDIHKVSFILFMVCSELYMVLTCLLLKDNKSKLTNSLERLAYLKKKQLMTANLTSFFVALYFFYRHNKYCEPGSEWDLGPFSDLIFWNI